MRRFLTFVSACAAITVVTTSARAQETLTHAQLNGEWTGTLALDNSTPRLALVFALTDSTFAGKVFADGTLFGEMEKGTVVGNRVHFKVDRFDFTGVVTGARMKIDLIVYNGSTRTLTVIKTPELPPSSPSPPSP